MAKKKDGRLSQNFGEPGHPARIAKDVFAKKNGARCVSAQTRKLWALFGWSRPDYRVEMARMVGHEISILAAKKAAIFEELRKLGVENPEEMIL